MGLAPYGEPKYLDRILGEVLLLHEDGSFHLNQKYFDFCNSDRHFRSRLVDYLRIPTRVHTDPLTQEHKDLAASVQKALEAALLNMLRALQKKYPFKNLCMAGGVALNCTANAELIRQLGIKLHIHPAAGDAGGALGAAIQGMIPHLPQDKTQRFSLTPYLGFAHTSKKINITLRASQVIGSQRDDIEQEIAKQLAEGHVVALLQGRDEWGPRALGNRSILASPLTAEMKDHLNAKIKFREQFRPFAPVVMEEYYEEYFETLDMENSPHMLFTHKVKKPSEIPAVVHVNDTGRVQTVNADQNPRLHKIIDEFRKITGVPVIINTSFNLRGEPIVSNPSDALKTFFNSGIDFLALEEYWVRKEDNEDYENE
jgi:carbamoyltransferase